MSSNKSFSSETAVRYARAIFELAQENSELDSIEKNFKDLLLVYNSNKELENFVRNPTKSFENQIEVMNKAIAGLEWAYVSHGPEWAHTSRACNCD